MKGQRLRLVGIVITAILFPTLAVASDDLPALLNEYAQKADLSCKTKQEAAGNLIIYTRQDLDRMQVKQLKELLARLPFLHYKENNFGLSDPFYSPYMPDSAVGIRLYINDRSLDSPYGGNALQAYAQMDMSYIDHVEIYMGAPALSFGAEQGAFVIKLYTKDPQRENTDVLGAYGGSYGTRNLYTYTAHVTDEGLKYLIYADYMDLKRKKIRFKGNSLNRNKRIGHFYAEFGKDHHRVEIETFRTKFNHFYAHSTRIDPVDGYPYSYATNLYTGYYYHDAETGIKGYINASHNKIHYVEKSHSAVGILAVPQTYTPYIYNTIDDRLNETVVDSQIRKRFKWKNWENETGFQVKYKSFRFTDIKLGRLIIPHPDRKDHETICALFNETGYQPNPNNILLLSFKGARYRLDERFNDRTQFFGRFGYIYNSKDWTFKSFIDGGNFIPELHDLYVNVHDFNRLEKLDSTVAYAVSTQFIRKEGDRQLSLFLSATEVQNQLYLYTKLDPAGTIVRYYDTLDAPMRFYNARLTYQDCLNEHNSIAGDCWGMHTDNRNDNQQSNDYGATLSHDFIWSTWTLHNDLIYRHLASYRETWNWNMALTWSPDRSLSLYIKGENLLDKGGDNRYFAVDPTPLIVGQPPLITRLNHVDPFDRRIWIGVEYQF